MYIKYITRISVNKLANSYINGLNFGASSSNAQNVVVQMGSGHCGCPDCASAVEGGAPSQRPR